MFVTFMMNYKSKNEVSEGLPEMLGTRTSDLLRDTREKRKRGSEGDLVVCRVWGTFSRLLGHFWI